MSEIYILKDFIEAQIEDLSNLIARAFQTDPLFVYLYPDSTERKVKSVKFCEYMLLVGIKMGEVYITSSENIGVAIWMAYYIKDHVLEKQPKEIIRRLRRVMKDVFSDPQFTSRHNIFNDDVNIAFHNERAKYPHWDLTLIAVDPLHQGKGYGSKLIKAKLAEIDEQNLPCSLHTENEKNVKLYEHFGFKIVEKISVPNSELKSWAMIRKKQNVE
jgi:ribosomal protein S18 acetylase RimI-like enzyme